MSLSKRLKKWAEVGVYFPFAYDATSKGPSVTLFFNYIFSMMLVGSLLALHFDGKLVGATTATALVWAMSTIFYLIRRITSAKVDLDDKSIELENKDDK